MVILLSLASSLLWGAADFLGGKASRARSTLLTVLISQAAGLLVMVVVALACSSFSAPVGYLPWAVGAGVAGASAVVLFYRALAIGTMGVVAPLAALGVIVPVILGVFGGGPPSTLVIFGIVVAIGGVVAAAGPGGGNARTSGHARSVLLALGAAVGFGMLQFAISGGSKYSTVMTMVAMRLTSVPLLALVSFFALRLTTRSSRGGREAVAGFTLAAFGVTCAIGVLDVSANLLFAMASVSGSLAIIAVLGSLYPAVTVLLARVVDQERLTRLQNVGVVAAVAGVAMIATGS